MNVDAGERLIDETVKFVFQYWAAISAVADVLIAEERVNPPRLVELVQQHAGEFLPPLQDQEWVAARLRRTIELAKEVERAKFYK